jgi:predicted Rdx family selenoprotein
LPQATGLVAELEAALPGRGLDFELVRGDKGVFEVRAEERVVFSKALEQRFPAYRELPDKVRALLDD